MKVNDTNVEGAGEFVEQAKADASLAKKSECVDGRWRFAGSEPQFSATMTHTIGDIAGQVCSAPLVGERGAGA